MNPEIYLCAGPQTGLTIGTKKIVKEINVRRSRLTQMHSSSPPRQGRGIKLPRIGFDTLDRINNDPTNEDQIVVSWFGPWWGDSKYINQGRFHALSNGKTGEASFGMTNRGSQLQATSLSSPESSIGRRGARSSRFLLGPMRLRPWTYYTKTLPLAPLDSKSSATMWRPTVNCGIFQQCTGDRCNAWMNLN